MLVQVLTSGTYTANDSKPGIQQKLNCAFLLISWKLICTAKSTIFTIRREKALSRVS